VSWAFIAGSLRYLPSNGSNDKENRHSAQF
jgi:hypothetical protein